VENSSDNCATGHAFVL